MKTATQNVFITQIRPTLAAVAFFLSVIPSVLAATDTWTGNSGVDWSAPNNWNPVATPQAGDSLVFSAKGGTLTDDLAAGTAIDGITFGGSAFTLNGNNSVLLSGSMAANTNGILNNSGLAQVIGTLPLSLDWGCYIFSSPLGGSVALNGGLTLNNGSVACFDPNVTSTYLTLDATTGLINGLEGAGLMYNAGTPTGLATLSGTDISAYTGYTTTSPGALSAGNNLQFNTTTAVLTNTYTANNLVVNTITSIQPGNSAGTSLDLIANTGTLSVGNNGGFYVLNAAAGAKNCLAIGSSGNGGAVTAGLGGGAPATLIFAVNGTTSGNQLAVNAAIWNNGTGANGTGGFPVTVETVGSGSLYFAVANSYSGGTYVNQGQLQGNNVNSFGAGPVYVGPGASIYLSPGGVWTNEIYLSPGVGASSAATAGGGALIGGGNQTLSGKIYLLGNPVTTAPGNRISTTGSSTTITTSGQITGTGTLDIYMGGHSGNIMLANAAGNNNWTGGLIIEPRSTLSCYFKMGANNQMPNGAGTGDIMLISGGGDARLDLNGFNTTINALNAPNDSEVGKHELTSFGTANCTLTMGANNNNGAFYGYSSDSGNGKSLGLVKIGTGVQTLAGSYCNHYGNTTVSNGTLQLEVVMPNSSNIVVASAGTLDASLAPNGGLTVGANQTLAGTGTVVGSTSINGTVAAGILAVSGASTNIGALTNSGSVTISGGATNFWCVNNAAGTAGTVSGWSFLNVINGGTLTINQASVTTPIQIKIVSLTNTGSAGNAVFNPNLNQSWTLVQTANPIIGYTGVTQFAVDTSAFANLPQGSAQFSVGTNTAGNSLVLYFTNSPVITNALVNQTNNAGTTAVFTVGAAGTTPITYQWIQQGTTVFVNGGASASGGAVTITTSGHTSTLTIANVQDADAGLISVAVTNANAGVGNSKATLTIIDPPANAYISQTGASDPVAGGVTHLAATTSSGTLPFTYVWSYNGKVISGATNSVLDVDVSPAGVGTYTVVISNQAGVVSNVFAISGPITSVPNQVIYEPFDSYGRMSGPNAPYNWEGVTNLYNQATGEPAYWYHNSGSSTCMVIAQNFFSYFNGNDAPGYPWPGLAGSSANCMYMDVSPSATDNDQLQFSKNGFAPGTSVYFSFLLNCDTFTMATSDCIAAFCNNAYDGTSFNLKLNLRILTAAQPGGTGTYQLGLYKGAGITGNQGVDAGTLWSDTFENNQDILVVGCYQINSGASSNTDDVVSLWFNPPSSTFGTTNVPVAALGPSGFGQPNSAIHSFAIHGVEWPGLRYFSDLRIGTTWASVTPTAAPELSLYNQYLMPGSNVVFASQNAGNPVAGNYTWTFNNGSGPVTLNDGSQYAGSSTSSLTILGATAADLGTYTVTGSNTDPAPADSGATLTGSASALLTTHPPALSISNNPPNIILSWPTNWDVSLEVTTNLLQPITWTPVSGVVVSGANDTVTIAHGSTNELFFQLAP
jgi:autotransporter-associated beta strand protein